MRDPTAHQPPPRSLPERLEGWVRAGLITEEQAQRIRQYEATPPERHATLGLAPSPAAGPSLLVEALGYLGGVVTLTGATILASLYWADLSVAVRLALLAASALALIAAGLALPAPLSAAGARLQSVLWVAGVFATGAFLAVFSAEVLHRHDEHALWILGGGSAVVAAVLWWLRRSWMQQLALFVPLLLAAAGAALELTSTDSSWGGAAVWGVAVLWTAAAWFGWMEPRPTGVSFGAIGAVLGALTMSTDLGVALGLATAALTVVLALSERNLGWLGVGSLALLYTTPRAVNQWFPGRLSAALTFLVTGGVLVGAAVWVARHRGEGRVE